MPTTPATHTSPARVRTSALPRAVEVSSVETAVPLPPADASALLPPVPSVTIKESRTPRANTRRTGALSQLAARTAAVQRGALQEGVRYTATTGIHGIGGKVFLEKKDGVVHITLPIAFVGAGLFSRIDDDVATRWGIKAAPVQWRSKDHVRSFEEIPAMKEHLLDLCGEIEEAFDTPQTKLHLDVRLPDELAFLSKDDVLAELDDPIADETEKWDDIGATELARYAQKLDAQEAYRSALSVGTQAHADNGEVISVIIDSMPDPRQIRPTLWSPHDAASLLAHEVGHLLGIRREGYAFNDYPISSLMTDEYGVLALKEGLGEKPKLSREDLHDMLATLAPSLDPPVAAKAVEAEFKDAREFKETVGDYFALSHEGKLALAQQRLERLRHERAAGADA